MYAWVAMFENWPTPPNDGIVGRFFRYFDSKYPCLHYANPYMESKMRGIDAVHEVDDGLDPGTQGRRDLAE